MAIDSEWEKFHGGPTQARGVRHYVSITRGGKILLNDRIYRDMGKPEAVHLFFNRQRDQIAIQSTSARLDTAFPVRKRTNRGYHIYASPFCVHFGIKIDATYSFIRPEFSNDGKLILKLSETVVVSRPRRIKDRARER